MRENLRLKVMLYKKKTIISCKYTTAIVRLLLYSVGPLVTMMGKMVKNMIYFVVLLLVVLLSFGVSRQAILNPNEEPKWRIIRDVRIYLLISVSYFLRYIYIRAM